MRQERHQEKTVADMQPQKLGKFPLDPAFHYVKVEKESPRSDYISPIDEMEGTGYKIVSEDRSVTGHGKMVLMACPVAEYDARQKEAEDDARDQRGAKGDRLDGGATDFERTETQGALTLDQLGATLKQNTA